jgi:DNA polymerase III delta prime subunit|tara:strand:- start:1877 stop:2482 length:606 start_codon:yes stop_codon:yes gene_type:complete
MSDIFESIKLNLERTIQGLITKKSEFIYVDNGSFVPENKTYSAYYLTDKSKLYFTNLITSNYVRQLIRVNDFDLYEQYTNITSVNREVYPSNITLDVTDKDYTKGVINRYFVKKANDVNAKVFEISKEDFNKDLTLYDKIKLDWIISGAKNQVIVENRIAINSGAKQFKELRKILSPLQHWRPSKDTPVTLEKKLSLLKKT